MDVEELIFKASDRTNVYRMCCKPSSKNSVKAVCHIAHGMRPPVDRGRLNSYFNWYSSDDSMGSNDIDSHSDNSEDTMIQRR